MHFHKAHAVAHVHTFAYVCTRTHTHTHICMHAHIWTHADTCAHLHTCDLHTRTHTCMCAHLCMCTHARTHTDTPVLAHSASSVECRFLGPPDFCWATSSLSLSSPWALSPEHLQSLCHSRVRGLILPLLLLSKTILCLPDFNCPQDRPGFD